MVIAVSVGMGGMDSGCNRPGAVGGAGQRAAAPSPVPSVPAPAVVGDWTGTQTGLVDVNRTPFRFADRFLPTGTYTLNGSWQGVNGPAGQTMSGTYTQSGAGLTLVVTRDAFLAAGRTTEMPASALAGLMLTGTISADGKSVHVGKGAAADYQLTRN